MVLFYRHVRDRELRAIRVRIGECGILRIKGDLRNFSSSVQQTKNPVSNLETGF
jgi:hypothetical protein